MASSSLKQWEIRSSTGKHFDVLDGIRGVAILMVVVYHAFYTNPSGGKVMQLVGGVFGTGWMGVPVFFVLSGFLISYPFFRERAKDKTFCYQRGYARRRIGKILPPFYLSIILFTTYYLLRFSDPAYLQAAWQWALGISNFIPAKVPFNASYWSLIVEAHFYILLPLLFLLTRGLKPRLTATVIFCILFLVPLAARYLTWPAVPARDTIAFLMIRFPCELDFFAWGILFAGIFVSLASARDELRALSRLGYVGIGLLALGIAFWALWAVKLDLLDHPRRWNIELFHILPGAAAFLMLFFVFDPECLGSRLLGHPWLRFTGIISYEWFLFHQPVVSRFSELFGQTHGNPLLYLGRTVVPLAITFGFSVLVYRFFSLPLLNRIRGARPAQATGASSAAPVDPRDEPTPPTASALQP